MVNFHRRKGYGSQISAFDVNVLDNMGEFNLRNLYKIEG